MRFFRWILSNIIMITIIVGLIYSYVYWGNLAGSDTPAGKAIVYLSDEFVEVKDFVDGVKAKNEDKDEIKEQQNGQKNSLALAESDDGAAVGLNHTGATASAALEINESKDSATVTIVNSSATAGSGTDAINNVAVAGEVDAQTTSTDVENAGKWQPVQQPVTISYSHNQMQVQQNSSGEAHALEQKSAATQVAASDIVQVATQKDGFVTPAIEKELEKATADGGVAALTPNATRKVWINARKAFYQRDFAKSEKRYKRVISMTKDNYDAYGELGNVYFHQGKNSDAADAYMEASVILIRLGHADRAHSLLGLMRYLDKDKALLLQKQLEQKK